MKSERVLDILKNALLLEERGRAFYKKAKEESRIEEVKKIFELMELEEEKHILFLKNEFQAYLKNKNFSDLKEFSIDFKQLDEKIFDSLKEKLNITDYESMALFIAITFEKEAVNFYDSKASQTLDENERKLFIFLRDWEKTHVNFLSKIDEKLKEKIWFDNRFWPVY